MRHHDALTKIKHAAETGQKRLDLSSMGLTELPPELAKLDKLETLDLSGNALCNLPEFMSNLNNIRHLFLTKNQFSTWPAVVSQMPSLEMVSFKSNQLTVLPEESFLAKNIHWLILTDNKLESLPENFGHTLPKLRKLALASNRLTRLPESFAQLTNLELLRLGMNCLTNRPTELAALPLLTWLGLGGNPYIATISTRIHAQQNLAHCCIDPLQFTIHEQLGSGASGVVYRAVDNHGHDSPRAIKQFKAISSDGNPEDELDIAISIAYKQVPSGIIRFHGWLPAPSLAMVMDYIPNAEPLGLVPSFQSITRDCYPDNANWSIEQVRTILTTMAYAQTHLIRNRVIHGDFYAHNILIDKNSNAHLGDWGASFFFEDKDLWMEKMEVRAFGCLMEELLARCPTPAGNLEMLRDQCLSPDPVNRPNFETIATKLH